MHVDRLLLLILLVTACSGGSDLDGTPTGGEAGSSSCAAGETPTEEGACVAAGVQPNGCSAGETFLPEEGACLAAGMQPNGCAAGELLTEQGCQPAGIPPDACAAGFVADGDGGCDPVLPAHDCPSGTMAAVGETSCREVGPCGTEPWDGIDADADTQFVDGSFVGSSDGTSDQPWISIQQGIDAATDGAVVAVAAGSYAESVVVADKAVQIWGRCPSMVEIVGDVDAEAAVTIGSGADGTVLRDVAVTGDATGVYLAGTSEVLLDALWLHDLSASALLATDGTAPTSVTLRDSLVEGAHDQAVWILGAAATIESSVIRGTTPAADGRGWALTAEEDLETHQRASLTVESCLLEDNVQGGAVVHAADAVIEATVIRGTRADPQDRFGRALMVQTEAAASGPGVATIRGCVLEQSRETGLMVHASDVTVEHTVIRDTQVSLAHARFGAGLLCQPDALRGEGSSCHVRQSLLERNSESTVLVGGSDVVLEGVLVRETQPWPDGDMGRGMTVQLDPPTGRASTASVVGSRFEDNYDAGLVADEGELLVEGTVIRATRPRLIDDARGWGLLVQDSAAAAQRTVASLRWSELASNHGMALVVGGSDATVAGTLIRDTQPSAATGGMGRGITIQDEAGSGQRSTFEVRSSVLRGNREAGMVIGGADGTVEATLVQNTMPEQDSDNFGRGIVVQVDPGTGAQTSATVRTSRIEGNRDVGLLAIGASLVVESTRVVETAPQVSDGGFGDGIAAATFLLAAHVRVTHSAIETSSRGGIASFGATIELGSSQVTCNAVDLNGEILGNAHFVFNDLGGNVCGCGDEPLCRVLSAALQPPEASDME